MIKKFNACLIIMAMFMLIANVAFGEELSPAATVSQYYSLIKNGEFEQAAEYVSKTMIGDKTKKEWANEWRKMFNAGKVVILEISVSPGKIAGDEAIVQLKTRSKDRFNSQGIDEKETDYLVKEDGVWKIDRTEVELPAF